MLRLLIVILIGLLIGMAGCGGRPETISATRLTQITTTEAVSLPGQNLPARADTTVVWLAADRTRRDNGTQSYVMRADAERMMVIDHAARSYLDVSFAEASKLMAGFAAAPDTARHPRDRLLRGMFRLSAKVTETTDAERIDGHDCRRYIIELRLGDTHIVSEQWVTGDLQIDDRQLRRASFATLLGLPGAAEAMAELARVQGVPVRTTTLTTLLNREIRSETRLAGVARVQVVPEFFAPPAGFQAIAPTLPVPETLDTTARRAVRP
jgi:hypothetical protein